MNLEKAAFTTGDLVVYPTHGVGEITAIEMQEIAGHTLNVFVVPFAKDRMTLRVPLGKAKVSGLRRLSSRKEMDVALAKLRGRSRAKRTMWSRRAQEYQAKIASGDPASIAEVVRDLFRNTGQPEQSYSERQIYQAALDRFVREYAAVERIDESTATPRIEKLLQLQFASNPGEVLAWMVQAGIEAAVRDYGGDLRQGFAASRDGPRAITRWTTGLRNSMNAAPGHTAFFAALRHAAISEADGL